MYIISFFKKLTEELRAAADTFNLQIENEVKPDKPSRAPIGIPERRTTFYGRIYELQCHGERSLELCSLIIRSKNHTSDELIYEARKLIALSRYPWLQRRKPSQELIDQLLRDTLFTPLAFNLKEKKQSLLNESIEILLLPKDVVTKLATALCFRPEHIHFLTINHLVSNVVSGDATCFSEDELCLILFKLFLVGLIEKE